MIESYLFSRTLCVQGFAESPKDEEIARARVFEEPLIPTASATVGENRSLFYALLSSLKSGNTEDLSVIEEYLREYPQSVWRLSLLTNMGIVYRHTGYFTRALESWE